MSEDEYYFDDYDLTEWEPYSAVDEIAEKTSHEPVILGYSTALELLDWDSEDDDSDDEYHDFVPVNQKLKELRAERGIKPKQRKQGKNESGSSKVAKTVRRPVLWKPIRERLRSPELPIWNDGQHQKVALCKDWRSTLIMLDHLQPNTSTSAKQRTKAHDRASPVMEAPASEDYVEVEGMALEYSDSNVTELPPLSLCEEQLPIAERKDPPTCTNGAASKLAKQAIENASSTNGNLPPQNRKRKASELSTDAETPDAKAAAKQGRGRKLKNKEEQLPQFDGTTENPPEQEQDNNEDEPPQKKRKRGRPKGSGNVPKSKPVTLASTRSTRNRKP